MADPAYAAPVLNRANARLSQDKLQEALEDYQRYLVLDPYSSQRAEVEAIIRALQGEMVYREQEKERIVQEEKRMKEEAARIEAENQRIAEAVYRKGNIMSEEDKCIFMHLVTLLIYI